MNRTQLLLSLEYKLYFEKISKTIPTNIKNVVDNILENHYFTPYNDSINEIINIERVINLYTDDYRLAFVNKYVDFSDKFVAINKNLNVDISKLKSYINYLVISLKIRFNRLRPFMQAYKYNKQIYFVGVKSIYNPSYPSGHSAFSRFLYRYYSDRDPNNEKKYFKLMRNIILSRIVAGVHFKSDCEFGIIVADLLYDRLKRENLLD